MVTGMQLVQVVVILSFIYLLLLYINVLCF